MLQLETLDAEIRVWNEYTQTYLSPQEYIRINWDQRSYKNGKMFVRFDNIQKMYEFTQQNPGCSVVVEENKRLVVQFR